MASHYIRGREIEYKIMAELKAAGYLVTRASSSKGNWDLIAIGKSEVRLISSKRATTYKLAQRTLASEAKKLAKLAPIIPPWTRQELWLWSDKEADGKGPGFWYCKEHVI